MKNIHLLPTDNQYKGSISLTPDGRLSTNVLIIGIPHHLYITSDAEIKDEDYCVHTNQNSIIKIGKGEGKLMKGHLYLKKIILTTDQDLIAEGVQDIDDEFLDWFVENPNCDFVEVQKWFDGLDFLEYKIIIPQEEPKNPNNQEVMFHEEHKEYFYEDFVEGKFVTVWLGKDYIPQEEPKKELQSYICPQTKMQCDDECCVSAEDCHIISSLATGMVDCDEPKHIPYKGKVWEPPKETLEEAAESYAELSYYNRDEVNAFVNGAKWQAKRMFSEEEVLNLLLDSEEFTSRFNGRTDLRSWFKEFKKK
jgi:hypothetical protein